MSQSHRNDTSKRKLIGILSALAVVLLGTFLAFRFLMPSSQHSTASKASSSSQEISYKPSADEQEYLKNKFAGLSATNSETVGYVYAPGTELDEPVVQTGDNATYLDKTFNGGNEPFMGTVFMDTDNKKDFKDRLTWLFGHARGSKVGDHRMFNDVNYYSEQSYFDQHKYVVIETPERKYYYEALAMVIVPEDTAFYRTTFEDDADFKEQLDTIYQTASVKNKDLKISAKDKYMVLSTCREEDETIRANLYLRQIPDAEMESFVAQHGEALQYKATRE